MVIDREANLTVPNQKLSPTSCIIIAKYPRLSTHIAANTVIAIVAGDYRWLGIIMQNNEDDNLCSIMNTTLYYYHRWHHNYNLLKADLKKCI